MAWSLASQCPCVPQDSGLYLKELIEPVLTCFNDADSRLRYYACEALYNIVKVARGSVLPHFNVLFDGLSKVRSFLLTPMCFSRTSSSSPSQTKLSKVFFPSKLVYFDPDRSEGQNHRIF